MKVCPTCRRCFEDTASACVDRSHPGLVRGPSVPLEVGGRWRLERLVEAAPDGAEFLGRHVELGRSVEIRVSTGPASAAALGRTRIAARALAVIRQENAARIEDFGALPGGGSYSAVERFGEETLRDALERMGPLAVPEAALLGRQIADALAALAAHGTAPARRALSSDEIGVGRGSHGEPIATIICFPNDEPDDAEDAVLRVGALLYEMLSGDPPRFGDADAPPAPLRSVRRDVPEALANLVMQSIHSSPAMRPKTPGELARRLRAFERAPDARSAWPAPPPLSYPPPIEVVVEDGPGRRAATSFASTRGVPSFPAKNADPDATVAVARPSPAPLPLTSRIGARLVRPTPVGGFTRPMDAGAAPLDETPAGRTAAFEAAAIVRPTPGSDEETEVLRRGPSAARVWGVVFAGLVIAAAAAWYVVSKMPARPSPGAAAAVSTPAPPLPAEPTLLPETVVASAEHAARVPSPAAAQAWTPAPLPTRTAARPAGAAPGDLAPADQALREALAGWIASTNSRDLSGQMRFYMPRLSTFYLERSVSQDTVRRVKSQLFALGPVTVKAGEPQITLTQDGRAATMRFRKDYSLGGPNGEKRGAVLQELRWVLTSDGWKILSERDAKVVEGG